MISNKPVSEQLILAPNYWLEATLFQRSENLPIRAVVALFTQYLLISPRESASRIQRVLFDRGMVCIGRVQVGTWDAHCFLASAEIKSTHRSLGGKRGWVSMTSLGANGRFANQLFQYAYVKLYALRHGLTAAFPAWEFSELFNTDDPPCHELGLTEMGFGMFDDTDRALWDMHNPPINVDFLGYFQELPECWRRQRPLLRRMFRLRHEYEEAINGWRDRITSGRPKDARGHPRSARRLSFATVPAAVSACARKLVSRLAASNLAEPESSQYCLWRPMNRGRYFPRSKEFRPVTAAFSFRGPDLVDFIRDFEILRRADLLAICNSSFSRMAAMLAAEFSKMLLPVF